MVPISIKQVLPLQRAELLCGIDYGLALTRVQRTLEVTLYVPPLILQSHYYVGTRIHACSLSFSAENYLLSVDLLSLSKALAPLQSWACYPHLWWWYLLTDIHYIPTLSKSCVRWMVGGWGVSNADCDPLISRLIAHLHTTYFNDV